MDYFVIKDRLHSTRIVFKGTDGTVVSRFDYAPYGEVIRSLESGDLVSFTYTGQEMDKHLGVMNYNARLYDPSLSRFLSADPLREFHSPYNYVGNNPFSFTDPSGMGSVNAGTRYDGGQEPFRPTLEGSTLYSGDYTGGSNTPGAEGNWAIARWSMYNELWNHLINHPIIEQMQKELNMNLIDARVAYLRNLNKQGKVWLDDISVSRGGRAFGKGFIPGQNESDIDWDDLHSNLNAFGKELLEATTNSINVLADGFDRGSGIVAGGTVVAGTVTLVVSKNPELTIAVLELGGQLLLRMSFLTLGAVATIETLKDDGYYRTLDAGLGLIQDHASSYVGGRLHSMAIDATSASRYIDINTLNASGLLTESIFGL